MIRHQTIGPNLHSPGPAPLGHQVQVDLVVAITEEGRLSPIAPLGHMMRISRYHHSCQSSHGIKLPWLRAAVNGNMYGVPRYRPVRACESHRVRIRRPTTTVCWGWATHPRSMLNSAIGSHSKGSEAIRPCRTSIAKYSSSSGTSRSVFGLLRIGMDSPYQ